jgi:hypothetical protein
MELAIDVIQRARCRLIAECCAHGLAADHTCQAHIAHQPFDGATGNAKPFALHLSPNFADTINRKVLGKYTCDFWLQRNIPMRPR